MATAQTIIDRSLRLVGALGSGESPSAAETADVLVALNAMIDSWQNDKLAIYAFQDVTKTLTPSTASYAIGSGQSIDTTRPVKVAAARVTQSGVDYPLEVIGKQQWDSIPDKATTSSLPELLYYYPSYPYGAINLWPVPTAANVLTLTLWVPVQSFATAATSVSLPNGYERALAYNLAIEVAPEFGMAVSQEVAKGATESKALIKRMNAAATPIVSRNEMATGRVYDIGADS